MLCESCRGLEPATTPDRWRSPLTRCRETPRSPPERTLSNDSRRAPRLTDIKGQGDGRAEDRRVEHRRGGGVVDLRHVRAPCDRRRGQSLTRSTCPVPAISLGHTSSPLGPGVGHDHQYGAAVRARSEGTDRVERVGRVDAQSNRPISPVDDHLDWDGVVLGGSADTAARAIPVDLLAFRSCSVPRDGSADRTLCAGDNTRP
jgi:hypothetical protein